MVDYKFVFKTVIPIFKMLITSRKDIDKTD